MNIDLGLGSRNTKETAKTRASLQPQPDDDGDAAEPVAQKRAPLEFEDVGGQVVDDAKEPENEVEQEETAPRMLLMDSVANVHWIQRLFGTRYRNQQNRWAGRKAEAHVAMALAANLECGQLGCVLPSFPIESRPCLGFHGAAPLLIPQKT